MEQNIHQQIPILSCPSKNLATQICCQPLCKSSALLCFQKQCPCHQKVHQNCSSIKLNKLIEKVLEKRVPITPQLQKTIKIIEKQYDDLIEIISKDKQQFRDWIDMYGLNKQQAQFLITIKQGNSQDITGQQISKIKEKINLPLTRKLPNQKVVLDNWQKKITLIQKSLMDYKIFLMKQYINSPLSSVITSDQKTLRGFFNKHILNFKLLFRASQHEFMMEQFHKNCDGVKNTVTLILTQYDRIIGGYTPLAWNTSNTWVPDRSNQTFIFSLTLKQKYPLKISSKAIYCGSSIGPTFGGGCDISIQNNCNTNKNSYSNFPHSYNNGKYQNNQQSYTAFSGSPSNYNFLVQQIQVFEIEIMKEISS